MRTPTLSIFLCLVAAPLLGQNGDVREEITFITDRQRLPDAAWQQELRQRPAWQAFLNAHGTWYVEFNEGNRKPHRAFGKPIATNGATALERAQGFITAELGGFGIPTGELSLMGVSPTSKHTYVHFKQHHAGLEVLFSHLMVKLDANGRAIGFGADVFDAIDVSTAPSLSIADAPVIASQGLTGITGTSVESAPRILPVPTHKGIMFHLVYETMVHTMNGVMPGRYRCFVDAHNGALLYRSNLVREHHPEGANATVPPPATDVTLTGNVYEFQSYIPAVNMPLAHVEVDINGTTYNTDMNGFAMSPDPGPLSATFRLQGTWSTVFTGSTIPEFTTTLVNGSNVVSFDIDANIRERSAYYHVNIVHDHCVNWLPGFTGMDFSLPTNVDVGGTCNAFYDGSSINFYAAGGGCNSFAEIGEVVYHEYGHGINDNFYTDNGAFFNNGAMNEGYADIWALSITEDPILAEGHDDTDPALYIRRYDVDPKVYPVDIVGETHADGEIIAGAWWDTYVQLGNDMNATMTLFAEAFPGLQATAANGDEGTAFRDVLIDVLNADDDDGDITNGTPNGNAIVEAFAIHGITLISNATLDHTVVETAAASTGIVIEADLNLSFPFTNYVESVLLRYAINNGTAWTDMLMTNTGGNNYESTIPGQPEGTVVRYYLAVQDIFGSLSAVQPIGCDLTDPNIPYFTLVGYALAETQDFDDNDLWGNWLAPATDDNNSSGTWSLEIPTGSFTDAGIIVQTDEQHTPGGELCWVTGNNAGPGDGIGTDDVDAGKTTLYCDPLNLSDYVNPTITFWRWYTNNPPGGANPGADWWYVQVTNNGTDWEFVENTMTSDKSWRRFAFRIADYVTPNSTVQIRFIASDSTHLGQDLDGGSLIEAAIDDIQLWDNAGTIGMDELAGTNALSAFPDPASDELTVDLNVAGARDLRFSVLDATGRVVLERNNALAAQRHTLDVSALPAGGYMLRATWTGGTAERRFTIVR